jgi:leucyl aminopeptidase (aminopeptidase T)
MVKKQVKRPGIRKVAEIILQNSIRPKDNETILILSDEKRRRIAQSIFEESCDISNPLLILSKGDLPRSAIQAISEADVVVLLSEKQIGTHPLILKARKEGTRIINMPGVDEEVFRRAVAVDYNRLAQTTELFAKKMEGANKVIVRNEAGTNLKFSIEHKPIIRKDGVAKKLREMISLPDGESCVAPVENSAEGIIMADGSMCGVRRIINPIELHVKKGRAFVYSDNSESRELAELMDKFGPCFSVVGKFGMGTNPNAELNGTLEDAKVLGTVSFGLGENKIFGGLTSCAARIDLVIKKPTVNVDGKVIMKNGQIEMAGLFR